VLLTLHIALESLSRQALGGPVDRDNPLPRNTPLLDNPVNRGKKFLSLGYW